MRRASVVRMDRYRLAQTLLGKRLSVLTDSGTVPSALNNIRGKRCLMDSSSTLCWPPFFGSQKTRCEIGLRPASPRITFACQGAAMDLGWRTRRFETRTFAPPPTSVPFTASLRKRCGDGRTSGSSRARTVRFLAIPSFGGSEPLETRLSSSSGKELYEIH